MTDKTPIEMLQELCGHIEDGSSRIVTITQDDSTYMWIVTPIKGKVGWSETLDDAIGHAYRANIPEGR